MRAHGRQPRDSYSDTVASSVVAVIAMSVVTSEPCATSTGSLANNAIAATAVHAPNIRHAANHVSNANATDISIALRRAGSYTRSAPFACMNSAANRNCCGLAMKPGLQANPEGIRRSMSRKGSAASFFSNGGCSGLNA